VGILCHPAALEFVEADGHYDYGSDDHLLQERRDAEQVAAVAEEAHDHGADDGSLPSVQAASTDYHGGDDAKFVTIAGGGLAGDEAGCFDHAGQAGEGAVQRIDERGIEADSDSGTARGFDVAADCVGVAAELRVFQNEPDENADGYEEQERHRDLEDVAVGENSEIVFQ